jgi:hypothetical protein
VREPTLGKICVNKGLDNLGIPNELRCLCCKPIDNLLLPIVLEQEAFECQVREHRHDLEMGLSDKSIKKKRQSK